MLKIYLNTEVTNLSEITRTYVQLLQLILQLDGKVSIIQLEKKLTPEAFRVRKVYQVKQRQ